MASVSSGSRTASEGPSGAIGHGFPARQVLNNQELAAHILGYFNEAENPKDDNKKALARLATLNRCFFHATTDLFWKTVPSLSPFLRLLPLYAGDDKAKADVVTKSLQKNPWGRFMLYHRKVFHLELSDDRSIKDEMPNHWFYCLSTLPSAPATLFPRLNSLYITSLAGLNSVIPFHISQGLQKVAIQDFTVKNKYDGLKKKEITSFMTAFACNAPSLTDLAVFSPLEPTMTTSYPHFRSLTKLTISFASPAPLEHLATINAIPSLKNLRLLSRGNSGTSIMPVEGHHLDEYSKEQGKAKLEELRIDGDGIFVFWATAFFASPTLLKFTARIPRIRIAPAQGVFLVPHSLDILAKRSTNIQGIAVAMEEPTYIADLEDELEQWEDDPNLRTPEGLFHSFSKLHDLTHFELANIPFIAQDMTLQLVTHATELRKLRLLSLQPRPLTNQPHHNLVLPSLESLKDISVNHPSLTFLRIMLTLAEVPEPDLGAFPSYPGHPLQRLFITPKYRPTNAPVSSAVSIATLVDRLFPQLQDMTSAFEEHSKQLANAADPMEGGVSMDIVARRKKENDQTLQLWKDVHLMVKNFQGMRRQFAAQALASRSGEKA